MKARWKRGDLVEVMNGDPGWDGLIGIIIEEANGDFIPNGCFGLLTNDPERPRVTVAGRELRPVREQKEKK